MINLREDTSLIVCAVRYALGRHSYMPSLVVGEIIQLLPYLMDRDLTCMRNDIADYLTHENENCIEYKLWSGLYSKIICEQEKREETDS